MTRLDPFTPAGNRRFKARLFIIALAISGALLLVLGANAHLAYVAFKSQPDCIPHAKVGESAPGKGIFSAAKSAC